MNLTVGSLFSGIGGLELGLERVGMQVKWQVEIDSQARQVLAHHWPEVQRFEDVTNVGRSNLPKVDVLVGGFPCQDLSVAGRRAGLAGERSGLWWQFHRIISELNPRWVIIENVPGLLSSNGGRDMGTVLGSLADLGYWWAYRVLDAQYAGVAQRRRRVFIVGHSGNRTAPATVLLEPESRRWNPPPRREAGKAVAGTLGVGSGAGGWGHDLDVSGAFVPIGFGGRAEVGGTISPTLVTDTNNAGNFRGIAHALTAHAAKGGDPTTDNYVTHTLSSESANNGGGAGALLLDRLAVRRLTPKECERLQGFPDNWTKYRADGTEISDSARYRMLGNAVCVNVAEWIGRRIMELEVLR